MLWNLNAFFFFPLQLTTWCDNYIASPQFQNMHPGFTTTTPAAAVYGPSWPASNTATALEQCITEQRWVRQSIQRSMIYVQVRNSLQKP